MEQTESPAEAESEVMTTTDLLISRNIDGTTIHQICQGDFQEMYNFTKDLRWIIADRVVLTSLVSPITRRDDYGSTASVASSGYGDAPPMASAKPEMKPQYGGSDRDSGRGSFYGSGRESSRGDGYDSAPQRSSYDR